MVQSFLTACLNAIHDKEHRQWLQDIVGRELEAALENGYDTFILGDEDVVAEDLIAYSSALECESVDTLVPMVRQWQVDHGKVG